MVWIFEAISSRLKALFAADLANTFEAQLASRQAQRKAELLRQADAFDKDGFNTVADDLRAKAESICIERPLATVLPAIGELRYEQFEPDLPLIEGNGNPDRCAAKQLTSSATAKKPHKQAGKQKGA